MTTDNLGEVLALARARLGDPVAPYLLDEGERRGVSAGQIQAAYDRAAGRLAQIPESSRFAFTDWEVLPPGSFDPRVLDQEVWWVDILRRPWRIAAGDPASIVDEHLLNVIEHLKENVPFIRPSWAKVHRVTVEPRDIGGARGWIARTPLYARLEREAEARGLR